MASLSDFVTDFSPRERAEFDAALRTGEHLRWAVRPLVKRGQEDWGVFVFSELIALGFLGYSCTMLAMLAKNPPADASVPGLFGVVLFVLLFFVMGLFIAAVPWLQRRNRRHTLYVLTNHRALISEPGLISSWSVQAYPLHEHMLRSRVCRPGGGGDLIFSCEGDGDAGFLWLPNLLDAHVQLNAAIAALLDAAEARGNRLH